MCIVAYRTAELCKAASREMLKKGGDFKVGDRTIELERREEPCAVTCAVCAERVGRD
jgi:hypothetical protein